MREYYKMQINLDLKNNVKLYIVENNLFNKTHKLKYTLNEILNAIFFVLITGCSWRSFSDSVFCGKYR